MFRCHCEILTKHLEIHLIKNLQTKEYIMNTKALKNDLKENCGVCH